MTRDHLISPLRQALSLVPALIRYDPLFRYAAIGAALFLLLVIGRLAQDWAGPGQVPPAPDIGAAMGPADHQRSVATPELGTISPAPAAPSPAAVPSIAPGRSLYDVNVRPAPADSFGTLPPRNRQP